MRSFDTALSLIVSAALIGLFILNAPNTAQVIQAAGGSAVGLIGAIQGR